MNFTDTDVLNNFTRCFRSFLEVDKPNIVVYFKVKPNNIYLFYKCIYMWNKKEQGLSMFEFFKRFTL